MANYIVQDTSLAAVADAIRAKTGISEKLVFPNGWKEAVEGITGGGGSVPFCAVSVKEGERYTAETVANFGVGVVVTGGEFIQTHAKYGGVRLPLIPEEILEQYPYAWITNKSVDGLYSGNTYRLFLSTAPWYYNGNSIYDGMCLIRTVTETTPVYQATLASEEWEFLQDSNTKQVQFGTYTGSSYLVWTNFDIPSGSASATSYYRTAMEPTVTI